jgi:hypothetical protein
MLSYTIDKILHLLIKTWSIHCPFFENSIGSLSFLRLELFLTNHTTFILLRKCGFHSLFLSYSFRFSEYGGYISKVIYGLLVNSCTHWLIPRKLPRIWAHRRGCFWSAKIDDISLWHPGGFKLVCLGGGGLSSHVQKFWKDQVLKKTSRRRITVRSSSNEISMDQLCWEGVVILLSSPTPFYSRLLDRYLKPPPEIFAS